MSVVKTPIKPILIITLIVIFIAVSSIFLSTRFATKTPNQFTVVTSFYPLYYFTSIIGADLVSVINLTPPGVEPHEYEPTPKDIATLTHSHLVIINGGGFEVWIERLQPDLLQNHIPIIDTASNLMSDSLTKENGPNEIDRNQFTADPHVWLDPVFALSQAQSIKDALITLDPAHSSTYEANFRALETDLINLHREFQTILNSCRLHTFITTHAAFGYLANRYQLKQASIVGLTPEDDPSPDQIRQVANLAQRLVISTIFFETLVSPRIAETIAQEVGATTAVLNPLEGLTSEELSRGETYLTIHRQNLQALSDGLQCY